MPVAYHDAVKEPELMSRKIGQFLGIPLDVKAMTKHVDASSTGIKLPGDSG